MCKQFELKFRYYITVQCVKVIEAEPVCVLFSVYLIGPSEKPQQTYTGKKSSEKETATAE